MQKLVHLQRCIGGGGEGMRFTMLELTILKILMGVQSTLNR